ncbi:acetyl esterase/lipase [Brevibacterium sanguinis]|uniref:Acetyl esterase/lipase n=2 Tax=Brevibacterium TaxID=1696 RepID=A0A366IEN8_9MICO|nr:MULTISPECIES: alpha/beta hydrolase [Brevibacterium]RBP62800.1 acetyl esterase/lipase [Brevibacterium sanguinis]RBP69365.1 acetyl esterase/lipase [Brevibacterium celere]
MITESFAPHHPELLIDLVLPESPAPAGGWPVIVWLHGGGWRLQDRTARPDFRIHFAVAGFAMASIDYRLAPAHPHPAQVLDLRQALRWLRRNAERFGLDAEAIGLWGSSAGSHIAAFTALSAEVAILGDERIPAGFQRFGTHVSCVVDGYGPTLIEPLLPAFDPARIAAADLRSTPEEDLLGGPATSASEDRKIRERARAASPALLDLPESGSASFSTAGLDPATTSDRDPNSNRGRRVPPPFLIMHGTADTAVGSEQSATLHERLSAAGGESLLCLIDGFGHGFLNPGEVLELGPGVVLDNGRLEAEPDAPCVFDNRGGFAPRQDSASFDLIHDFFVHHLKKGRS